MRSSHCEENEAQEIKEHKLAPLDKVTHLAYVQRHRTNNTAMEAFMSKLVYRGVEHTVGAKQKETLADQMRRHDLVYRGVAHDGDMPRIEQTRAYEHVYRGVRYA